MAMPIVEPNSVWRLEIVAHVKIRGSVAIEIAEGNSQPKIPGTVRQRLARLVQECPLGPRHAREPAMAVIEIEGIARTIFGQLTANDFQSLAGSADDLVLAIDPPHRHRT